MSYRYQLSSELDEIVKDIEVMRLTMDKIIENTNDLLKKDLIEISIMVDSLVLKYENLMLKGNEIIKISKLLENNYYNYNSIERHE